MAAPPMAVCSTLPLQMNGATAALLTCADGPSAPSGPNGLSTKCSGAAPCGLRWNRSYATPRRKPYSSASLRSGGPAFVHRPTGADDSAQMASGVRRRLARPATARAPVSSVRSAGDQAPRKAVATLPSDGLLSRVSTRTNRAVTGSATAAATCHALAGASKVLAKRMLSSDRMAPCVRRRYALSPAALLLAFATALARPAAVPTNSGAAASAALSARFCSSVLRPMTCPTSSARPIQPSTTMSRMEKAISIAPRWRWRLFSNAASQHELHRLVYLPMRFDERGAIAVHHGARAGAIEAVGRGLVARGRRILHLLRHGQAHGVAKALVQLRRALMRTGAQLQRQDQDQQGAQATRHAAQMGCRHGVAPCLISTQNPAPRAPVLMAAGWQWAFHLAVQHQIRARWRRQLCRRQYGVGWQGFDQVGRNHEQQLGAVVLEIGAAE